MSERYISNKKENFAARCLKGIGYWFLGNFMCFFICSSTALFMRSFIFIRLFIAFCTMTVTLGLYFNWAHYAAKRDKNVVKFHGMEYDRYMPLKMAIAAPIFSYIMLIVLYLSKSGVLPDVFNYYLLLNMWLRPFVTLFTGEFVIDAISWLGVIGITFMVLLQPLTIAVTYILTYNDVDVTKIIFYKKH